MIRRTSNGFMWEGVDVLPYKEDGNVFKSVTRQTLFKGEGNLPVELRYFEVGVGGHSTLERHDHQHIVMIIRGSGQVFVGDTVSKIALHDVVHVPPLTWHQFRATHGEELGFLCVVSCERDRPQRPDEDALRDLRDKPEVAEFIRV